MKKIYNFKFSNLPFDRSQNWWKIPKFNPGFSFPIPNFGHTLFLIPSFPFQVCKTNCQGLFGKVVMHFQVHETNFRQDEVISEINKVKCKVYRFHETFLDSIHIFRNKNNLYIYILENGHWKRTIRLQYLILSHSV